MMMMKMEKYNGWTVARNKGARCFPAVWYKTGFLAFGPAADTLIREQRQASLPCRRLIQSKHGRAPRAECRLLGCRNKMQRN